MTTSMRPHCASLRPANSALFALAPLSTTKNEFCLALPIRWAPRSRTCTHADVFDRLDLDGTGRPTCTTYIMRRALPLAHTFSLIPTLTLTPSQVRNEVRRSTSSTHASALRQRRDAVREGGRAQTVSAASERHAAAEATPGALLSAAAPAGRARAPLCIVAWRGRGARLPSIGPSVAPSPGDLSPIRSRPRGGGGVLFRRAAGADRIVLEPILALGAACPLPLPARWPTRDPRHAARRPRRQLPRLSRAAPGRRPPPSEVRMPPTIFTSHRLHAHQRPEQPSLNGPRPDVQPAWQSAQLADRSTSSRPECSSRLAGPWACWLRGSDAKLARSSATNVGMRIAY